jgi:hypothetical protein
VALAANCRDLPGHRFRSSAAQFYSGAGTAQFIKGFPRTLIKETKESPGCPSGPPFHRAVLAEPESPKPKSLRHMTGDCDSVIVWGVLTSPARRHLRLGRALAVHAEGGSAADGAPSPTDGVLPKTRRAGHPLLASQPVQSFTPRFRWGFFLRERLGFDLVIAHQSQPPPLHR